MKPSQSRLTRRNFLLAVGASGVATAAVVTGNSEPTKQKKAEPARGSQGYQLSAHVKKYYDTTKV